MGCEAALSASTRRSQRAGGAHAVGVRCNRHASDGWSRRGRVAQLLTARRHRSAGMYQLRLLPSRMPHRRKDVYGRDVLAACDTLRCGDSTGMHGTWVRDRSERPHRRGRLPVRWCGPSPTMRRGVSLRRCDRNATPSASHRACEFERSNWPQLYGARRDASVGHVRARDPAKQRGYPSSMITEDAVRPPDADFAAAISFRVSESCL